MSHTFERRRDAERWQRDQLADRVRGLWVDAQLGKRPLRAWYEEWWPSRTELRPSTVARDDAYYRTHVLPAFGDMQLMAIDYESVTRWVAELSASGLAPVTVRRCHQLLSKLLNGAVKARRIYRNPCVDTDNPPTVEQSEMLTSTPKQVAVLADAIYDVAVQRLGRRPVRSTRDDCSVHEVAERFAALVPLAGYGGLRFGLWIAHEATPKQVQVWAGHRSVATVFDRYGHLFPGGEDPIMDALDETAGSVGSGPSGELNPGRCPKSCAISAP